MRYTHIARPLARSPRFLSNVAKKAAMNIKMILSQILPPVTVPSTPHTMASNAPMNNVRTRQLKEPFISTHEIPSAVRVIHVASSSRPVARPHIIGTVPDMAIRKPQLTNGSKLSF